MARIITLDGAWTAAGYYPGARAAGAPPCVGAMPARVPGVIQGDLIRARALPDPRVAFQSRGMEWTALREWVYTTRFTIPDEPQEGRSERFYVQLGGVAGLPDVYINGAYAGRCASVWERPVFDVTGMADTKGENELELRFPAAPELYGRYARLDRLEGVAARFFGGGWQGCPPLPVTGLTEGVTLRCVSFLRIEHAALRALPYGTEGGRIHVTLRLDAFAAGRYNFKYRVLLGDELAANEDISEHVIAARAAVRHTLTLPRALLWEPGVGGNLYRVMLTITRGGVRCDMTEAAVAFRAITYNNALEVNGKPVFINGARWMPSYPYFEDMRGAAWGALSALRVAGFNLVRVFGGALPPTDAFLDACDALGLLVWCDCPLAPGEGELGAHPGYIAALERAAEALIRRVSSHPCCALLGGGGLCDADGGALDSRHPTLGALARLVGRDDASIPFLPDDGPFEYVTATGVATHRNAAMQAGGAPVWPPDVLTPLLRHQDAQMPAFMGALCGVPDERQHTVFELGRALQAARLRRALLHARKWDGAGIIVEGVNETFPALASTALIEHDGALRPAFWAAMDALADDALYIECAEGARPGDAVPFRVCLLSRRADGRLLNARVRVMTVMGELLVSQQVSQAVGAGVAALFDGVLEAPGTPCLLVLRAEGQYGGAPLRPATEFLRVGDGQAALDVFLRLPPVRLSWTVEDGAWRLKNTSLYVAAHVVIHPSRDGAQPVPGVVTLPPHESAVIAGVMQPAVHALTALNEQVSVTVEGTERGGSAPPPSQETRPTAP